nr:hypothetical protein [Mammaliicoccus sp. Marseille-Q6498]
MKIYPNTKTLQYWNTYYFNDFDLFFVDNITFKDQPVLITSKQSFKGSNHFNIQTNNLYEIWNLKDYNYVIQAPTGWFESLNTSTQSYLLEEQCRLNNPLYLNDQLITSYSWKHSDDSYKTTFFNTQIDLYEDNIIDPIQILLPTYLESIINTFSLHQGSNCLSTVLYIITKSEQILNQWIKQDTFINTINQFGYKKVTKSCSSCEGDIIAFSDNQSIIHATYQITGDLFLNKNGQTIFNPYKVITQSELNNNWGSYEKHIYRKD